VFRGKVRRVKILTSNITEDKNKFKFSMQSMEAAFGFTFEIRESRKPHGRYILYGNCCILLDSSLKDLGKKDTDITEDNSSLSGYQQLFTERWNSQETTTLRLP
jgi:hypothetical protein